MWYVDMCLWYSSLRVCNTLLCRWNQTQISYIVYTCRQMYCDAKNVVKGNCLHMLKSCHSSLYSFLWYYQRVFTSKHSNKHGEVHTNAYTLLSWTVTSGSMNRESTVNNLSIFSQEEGNGSHKDCHSLFNPKTHYKLNFSCILIQVGHSSMLHGQSCWFLELSDSVIFTPWEHKKHFSKEPSHFLWVCYQF